MGATRRIGAIWGVRGAFGLAGNVGTEVPAWVKVASGGSWEVYGVLGASGAIREDWAIRGCREVRGALGSGRECRYSGVSMGIGGIRWLLGVSGRCWGPSGGLGPSRVLGVHFGLAGRVNTQVTAWV